MKEIEVGALYRAKYVDGCFYRVLEISSKGKRFRGEFIWADGLTRPLKYWISFDALGEKHS